MMSTVVEVVDEGLGEDFEDTPWVPPTVKRVSYMKKLSAVQLAEYKYIWMEQRELNTEY